jgi:hypothetical protein
MVLNHIRRNLQLMTPPKINLSQRASLFGLQHAGDGVEVGFEFYEGEVELHLVTI